MTHTPAPDMEDVFEALAAGIDAAGPEREAFFLSKVALLLAHELADPARALALIAAAQADPEPMREPLRDGTA